MSADPNNVKYSMAAKSVRGRRDNILKTVGELRDRIRALASAGYKQLTIQLVPGHEAALDDWAHVIEGV